MSGKRSGSSGLQPARGEDHGGPEVDSMKLHLHLLTSLALLAPASAAQAISRPSEASELRARSDPGLLSLRGGRVQQATRLGEDERASLREAEAASPELSELRAGGVIELLLIIVLVLLILTLI